TEGATDTRPVTHETYGPRTRAWRGLQHHASVLEKTTIRALFDAEPNRFNHFSLEREGLVLDFSRQLLDRHALGLLVELAEQTEVPRWRSEEHTSELQSRENLVCRLLLEKKNMERRGVRIV